MNKNSLKNVKNILFEKCMNLKMYCVPTLFYSNNIFIFKQCFCCYLVWIKYIVIVWFGLVQINNNTFCYISS